MGAGKSRALVDKAWWLARHYPGAELGVFRKIHASLVATTERTFWQEVADLRYVLARHKSEHWVDIATAGKPSRIWWLGLDPDPVTGTPSRVGSLNLDWAGVDEAVELTDADWVMLQGRLRRQSLPYRQLAGATNPASPTHWLKRRFAPGTPEREYIAVAENRYLPPDYIERLAALGTGVHAQRLGKGLWVGAEGQIWRLPDDQVGEPEQTVWKRTVAGADWGYVHAFAFEVVAESGSGRRATLDEIYERGRTVPDLIPLMKAKVALYGITTIYADPSEPAYIEQCRRAGLPIVEAPNAVLPGITSVEVAIARGMQVSPKCAGLLGELPEYVWQTDRGGSQREKPVEIGDDACDAWRYANLGLDGGGPGVLDYYKQRRAPVAAEQQREGVSA